MSKTVEFAGYELERFVSYTFTTPSGVLYNIVQNGDHPSSRHTVSRVTPHPDGSLTLTVVDRWYGIHDAITGALADASKQATE